MNQSHNESPIMGQLITYLFYRAEPVLFDELKKIFSLNDDSLRSLINELHTLLDEQGFFSIIQTHDTCTLVNHKNHTEFLHNQIEQESIKELTKSNQEILAIILYHPGISKQKIDSIRGVNSFYGLKVLLERGLIEKHEDSSDKRGHVFFPTENLFAHLGINSSADLPHIQDIQNRIDTIISESSEE